MMTRRDRIIYGIIWTIVFFGVANWLSSYNNIFLNLISFASSILGLGSAYDVFFGSEDNRCPNCGIEGGHSRDREAEKASKRLKKFMRTYGSRSSITEGRHFICKSCAQQFSEIEAINFHKIAKKYGEEFALSEYKGLQE